ncbi:MAG: BLUF domain-containing protein [Aestuariibacter sp.]
MVYQLVYMSKATITFDDAQLKKLMVTCEKNNAEFEITGLLVFCNGYFMQLIEGEEHHVTSLFNVIKQDPRHTDVSIILSKVGQERLAQEWSMGLYKLDKNTLRESEIQEFTLENCRALKIKSPNMLWNMVYRFIDAMREQPV